MTYHSDDDDDDTTKDMTELTSVAVLGCSLGFCEVGRFVVLVSWKLIVVRIRSKNTYKVSYLQDISDVFQVNMDHGRNMPYKET
jgi:hypothetical protein